MKITLPKDVEFILRKLSSHGFEAYIVGGCVRDSVLGIIPNDWDITTNAKPKDVINCFRDYQMFDNGVKHGTVSVIINNNVYEITTFRIDGDYEDFRHPKSVQFSTTLKDDLARRDFTINAMAYSPDVGLIDYYGGVDDLNLKAIRCVGAPKERFNEDALRILRGLRFASVYGFSIEIKTSEAVLATAELLNNISEERIASEFNKLLCGETASYILNRFKKVIAVFIPEIKVMFNFDQNNPHHDKTLWRHTTSTIFHIENDLILRLTMFFHDIGKPMSRKYDEIKKLCHYKGHGKFSSAIAENVLKRLKYSNDIIETVTLLIKYHDVRFSDNKKQIKHVLTAIGEENFVRLLKVQKADMLAQSSYNREEKLRNFALAEQTFAEVIKEKECFKLCDMDINGHDLIHLGITNGIDIGRTLKLLLSMIIDEKIENKKDVLIEQARRINNL